MKAFIAYYASIQTVSPVVRPHLPSVEWLVSTGDSERRTGRTTALALAFLRNSFSNPTVLSRVYDHYMPVRSDSERYIQNKIREMAPELGMNRDGIIDPQPAQAGPGNPQFQDTLTNVRADFRALCAAAVRLGIRADWMIDQVSLALAESVIRT